MNVKLTKRTAWELISRIFPRLNISKDTTPPDVVIFRYLISVKRWFALPDLQKVKFVTVACNAMRSAIGNERRKRAKEPQTVSLYDPIPGTEDLLYIDTIAAPEIL